MKNGEYEKAYQEARAVLYRRGKRLEKPTLGDDGKRYCRVDGEPLTDRDLLREAWGESLANEILYERGREYMLGRAG